MLRRPSQPCLKSGEAAILHQLLSATSANAFPLINVIAPGHIEDLAQIACKKYSITDIVEDNDSRSGFACLLMADADQVNQHSSMTLCPAMALGR